VNVSSSKARFDLRQIFELVFLGLFFLTINLTFACCVSHIKIPFILLVAGTGRRKWSVLANFAPVCHCHSSFFFTEPFYLLVAKAQSELCCCSVFIALTLLTHNRRGVWSGPLLGLFWALILFQSLVIFIVYLIMFETGHGAVQKSKTLAQEVLLDRFTSISDRWLCWLSCSPCWCENSCNCSFWKKNFSAQLTFAFREDFSSSVSTQTLLQVYSIMLIDGSLTGKHSS